ncbi:ParB/RepB/Spo0J family partition protein [Sphingomonadaceae bacterium OTU29THOMA1]|nr:ParB/RepB/Spo0J family partition protein [Sphingomonadaceae bacterium OTU29THOMA1]
MPDIIDSFRTIDQLCLSPFNCRIDEEDANDTEQLEALILADGLMYPMSIHQMRGSKTKWGAFAGGRRYRSIRNLAQRGAVPADTQWKVCEYIGYSDAELIELSVKENLPRRENRQYEVYAAVRKAHALGHTVQQIATNLNQDPLLTQQWLRLGQMAKPVFDALAAGRITDAQARAFAGTDDQKFQQLVFERLTAASVLLPAPAEIRKALDIGEVQSQRDLLFVGLDTYRAAGGTFELDLFAEVTEERGRVRDQGKLQELVDAKMATIRDQVRVSTDRPNLRFIAGQPRGDFGPDHQLIFNPKLVDGRLDLPDGDAVVAHIAIDASGQPVVSYWWESRKAKFGSEKKPAPAADPPPLVTPAPPAGESPFAAKHRADAAAQQDDGLSQDAMFALRATRKAIARAALIDDARLYGGVGHDYLIWAQARLLLVEPRPVGIGMRGIAGDTTSGMSADAFGLARDLVAATVASRTIADAIAEIKRQDFFTEADPVAAFLAWRTADPELKTLTAAVVAGIALDRAVAGEMPIHDVIVHECGAARDADVRTRWSPTADFLNLFPKEQRLGFARPFVDNATFVTWGKLKSTDLTSGVLSALTRGGQGSGWVHPTLRFNSPFLAHQLEPRAAAE